MRRFEGLPGRVRFEHRSRRIGITGIQPNPNLFRLLDDKEMPVRVPESGVMLNSKLADLLDVEKGDKLIVEILEGKRPTERVEVTAIISEFGGLNAYMRQVTIASIVG